MHGQETLEDYDSCGIFGDEQTKPKYKPNRARIGDDYECLWDCEWQFNPFYKSGDIFYTKLGLHIEQFPMVHTSPQLPTNLTCLSDCFSFYKNPRNDVMTKKRSRKRVQCSAQGFDTLVPTHHEFGVNFTASQYSDMALWKSSWEFYETIIGSWNPNLDCLMLLESIPRQQGDHTGNFIPAGNAPSNQGGKRKLFRTSNGENLPAEGNRVLRASNPLSSAVEICAFAKLLQFVKSFNTTSQLNEAAPDMEDFFAAGPPGCDNFLPDIFKPVKCRCVGTCDPHIDPTTEEIPTSLHLRFDSDLAPFVYDNVSDSWSGPGLVGCHGACVQEESCKFFTYSNESYVNADGYVSKKHVCRLWKSCDSFRIPADSTYSFEQQENISLHWSGPKRCGGQYSCPLLPKGSDSYQVDIALISDA